MTETNPYPFFTDTIKFPVLSTEKHFMEGKMDELCLLYRLKRERKFQSIFDWKNIDYKKFAIETHFRYIRLVGKIILHGWAHTEKGGKGGKGETLILHSLESLILPDIGIEKFARVKCDRFYKERIQAEVIRHKTKYQEYHIGLEQKEKTGTSASNKGNELRVVKHIGEELKEYMIDPDADTNYSCLGIAKMFGYTSSYSGWKILKSLEELGFIKLYKRFINAYSGWRSQNLTIRKTFVKWVSGVLMMPIASEIEISLSKWKKGIAHLKKPKYRVDYLLNSLYGDII